MRPFPRVAAVRHVENYILELTFTDGIAAELDFRTRIVGRGGEFAPLEDIELFSQVVVDPEARTLVWPNGVDFCPDVLYADATGRSLDELHGKLQAS
ncbi:MAG: DUF2442 domain-containing protein [Planctomycetaceae bacterium]